MRKLLSIVISILMISAMMSAVAFADGEATITLAGTQTGLVAGEAVTLTPTITVDGATTYTVEVNSQVFGITGGSAVEGKTIIKKENIPVAETFELTVNTSIPQTFESEIKITAGAVSQKFAISVADRLVGDANGDAKINSSDATIILKAYAGKLSPADLAIYKARSANANKDSAVNSADATLVLKYYAGKLAVSNPNGVGVAYLGGDATIDIVDPFAVVTPEPVQLAAPTNVYAYYQDGKLYYTFDAVAGASSYTIKVGDAEAVAINTTSGSISNVTWPETGTLAVTVVAVGDGTNYTSSTGTTVNAVYANVSGQLSQWLADNNLSDVAITVYEITAE